MTERPANVRRFFLLHMRPTRLPAATLRYTHTFGLGGMSAVLVTLLVLTGPLMMLAYEPTPERALTPGVRTTLEAEGVL